MELILKSDVPNLGFKDDVVIVKNGYGRNYLIPQGFAILATPSAKKVLAENIKQREFKEKKEIDEANKIAKKLAKLEIKNLPVRKTKALLNYIIENGTSEQYGARFIAKFITREVKSLLADSILSGEQPKTGKLYDVKVHC